MGALGAARLRGARVHRLYLPSTDRQSRENVARLHAASRGGSSCGEEPKGEGEDDPLAVEDERPSLEDTQVNDDKDKEAKKGKGPFRQMQEALRAEKKDCKEPKLQEKENDLAREYKTYMLHILEKFFITSSKWFTCITDS